MLGVVLILYNSPGVVVGRDFVILRYFGITGGLVLDSLSKYYCYITHDGWL